MPNNRKPTQILVRWPDAVTVLFGVKPSLFIYFLDIGEWSTFLERKYYSPFTENAIKMIVEMHWVLCIYFILNVKVSGI